MLQVVQMRLIWYMIEILTQGCQEQELGLYQNGWISPNHALIFGIIIAIGGSALFLLANWKAAFWSIFSVLFYVFVYTIWLKRRTPQNIVIGGIAGSTLPLIGWIVASIGKYTK